MTGRRTPGHGAVRWLTAQTLLFGAMAALLGVVANAMFLEAYGAESLPVTYIVIGFAGIVISGAIARGSQRFDLLRIAVVVLGAAAALLALSWVAAVAPGGAWVSGPLLVLFPILLQLGFVFVGGQAGRILDIAGIKAGFPRIMAGFPAGAVVGGVAAVPLVDLTGRSEDLLLATALVQGAFAGLVWATGRRYRSLLELPAQPGQPVGDGDRPGDRAEDAGGRGGGLRRALGGQFVLLILAYQVLSALGSQLSDFLVFHRAEAAFPAAEDLARFIGGYTAVMNVASIAFLFLVAGPLLRRFGLRLGIAANPAVLMVLTGVMAAVLALAGAGSMVLLGVVAAARIADIALTDGTTRTSINAMYQVLPARPRIAVQTAVEGIGVPVAIGVSGALILVLNTLPDALGATIAVLLVTCAVWTWIGLRLYGAYGPALVGALQRRRAFDPEGGFEATVEDVASARRLVASGDPRSVRLGIELASDIDVAALAPELATVADNQSLTPAARLAALAALTVGGDAGARRRLAAEASLAADSPDPAVRVGAARVLPALDAADRETFAVLLDDADASVRRAALDAVRPGDDAIRGVVRALADVRLASAAMRAFDRLGDAAVPAARSALEAGAGPARPVASRMLRGLVSPSPARAALLEAFVDHPDRSLGRLVLDRVAAAQPAPVTLARKLRDILREETAHAARVLASSVALRADAHQDGLEPVLRALDDELGLVRARVAAAIVARHGRERLGQSVARLATGGEHAALALETIEVVAGPGDARLAAALFEPGLSDSDRLERLESMGGPVPSADAGSWLRSIAEDPDDAWRSPWLRACAIRALRLRGGMDAVELADASLAEPVVAEELALAGVGPGVRSGDAPP